MPTPRHPPKRSPSVPEPQPQPANRRQSLKHSKSQNFLSASFKRLTYKPTGNFVVPSRYLLDQVDDHNQPNKSVEMPSFHLASIPAVGPPSQTVKLSTLTSSSSSTTRTSSSSASPNPINDRPSPALRIIAPADSNPGQLPAYFSQLTGIHFVSDASDDPNLDAETNTMHSTSVRSSRPSSPADSLTDEPTPVTLPTLSTDDSLNSNLNAIMSSSTQEPGQLNSSTINHSKGNSKTTTPPHSSRFNEIDNNPTTTGHTLDQSATETNLSVFNPSPVSLPNPSLSPRACQAASPPIDLQSAYAPYAPTPPLSPPAKGSPSSPSDHATPRIGFHIPKSLRKLPSTASIFRTHTLHQATSQVSKPNSQTRRQAVQLATNNTAQSDKPLQPIMANNSPELCESEDMMINRLNHLPQLTSDSSGSIASSSLSKQSVSSIKPAVTSLGLQQQSLHGIMILKASTPDEVEEVNVNGITKEQTIQFPMIENQESLNFTNNNSKENNSKSKENNSNSNNNNSRDRSISSRSNLREGLNNFLTLPSIQRIRTYSSLNNIFKNHHNKKKNNNNNEEHDNHSNNLVFDVSSVETINNNNTSNNNNNSRLEDDDVGEDRPISTQTYQTNSTTRTSTSFEILNASSIMLVPSMNNSQCVNQSDSHSDHQLGSSSSSSAQLGKNVVNLVKISKGFSSTS